MGINVQSVNRQNAESGQSQRSVSISRNLSKALKLESIKVVYQPQLELSKDQLVAFEALARWTDPALGLVSPAEFIPIAESTGQVTDLGSLILKRAISDLAVLQANWPAARLAINVSSLEIQDPKFVVRVTDALQHAGNAAAEHLEFELTETALSDDIAVVTSNIQALRKLGATVAIDDFGTGASTLARLCHIPFDKIKLDKAFVAAINQPTTRSIIKAMVTLADEVGAKLVIEGVETEEQLTAVSSLGCSIAQGYLLGIPRPLEELVTEFKGSD